ncbi:MAG TPA: DUF4118 domain-containing protein [Vicinamibacterales bacterium]|nr:DUF4118 domain-containing protein [Vicinamibacterales bacterium]
MDAPDRFDLLRLAGAMAALLGVTLLLRQLLGTSNAATVSTIYLLLVLVVAATSRLWVAVAASVAAMLGLNFFFLPPVHTFTIADPQNWIALFAFLAVSLIASNLSAIARARTAEAISRRDELARLFDLSREVLLMTDSREALSVLARAIARRFDLAHVAIALPRGTDWDVYGAGSETIDLDRRQLTSTFAAAQTTLEFDAHARTYAGHRTITVDGQQVRLVPLRAGTKPIGVVAAAGRPVEAGTLETLAGVVAIAIERAQFLEERKAGELTRQSEQLKTALLASLGHDLRTPLTAIRVAAANLQADGLTREERLDQTDLIQSEVERLTRLFQNLLEMARIDAGAVAAESRWVHPSEILSAARDQVEHALSGHQLTVMVERDVPIRVDPRVTATALAHLLENAAQYSPPGTTIDLDASVDAEGLLVHVRDRGPGISAADLPHLYERFYRGETARPRTSGTGMGLWIARKLLAVVGGRTWAENCADGGTRFSIMVPAIARSSDESS